MDWPSLHPLPPKNGLRLMGHQQRTEWLCHKSARKPLLCVLLVFPFLAACGERQDESKNRTVDEEAVLMEDIQRAVPELDRRLRARVSVQDGLILVRDPEEKDSSTYVLPANSPWVISCGFGLSVVFGTAISGDASSVDNNIKLELTQAFVTQDKCSILALHLGRRVHDMLRADTNPP
jgi:hypothetical protein